MNEYMNCAGTVIKKGRAAEGGSCLVCLDLSSAGLPEDTSISVRGYDAHEQLRFSRDNVSPNEILKMDSRVTVLMGIALDEGGNSCGFFAHSVSLRAGAECAVINAYLSSPMRRKICV